MTIKLSSKAGQGIPRLAPDLTFPSSLAAGEPYVTVAGIDPSASLTTILNLSGKFIVSMLQITSFVGGGASATVKLTVDGVIIWNDTYVPASPTMDLVNSTGSSGGLVGGSFRCESSCLLELQTPTDTSVNFNYNVRPIL